MKKIISILICIQIALFPTFLFAAGFSNDDWLKIPEQQGSNTTVNGSKTYPDGRKATSKITIPPNVKKIAKQFVKGAGAIALANAVSELIGLGVDWVLDPDNNRVVYKEAISNDVVCYGSPNAGNCSNNMTIPDIEKKYSCTLDKVPPEQQYSGIYWGSKKFTWIGTCYQGANGQGIMVGEMDIPAEKTLSLDDVAQKVIQHADSGDSTKSQPAQDVIKESNTNVTPEEEKALDNELEKNKKYDNKNEADSKSETEKEKCTEKDESGECTATETEKETTTTKTTFPKACEWMPNVCEAMDVVISSPEKISTWWDSVKEWATAEPELKQDETDLPIEDASLDKDPSSFDTDYIVLGSQCPTFEPYTVEVGPVSKTLSMDLMPLCEFAQKVRPAILGMSYLTAAGIVVAAIRET